VVSGFVERFGLTGFYLGLTSLILDFAKPSDQGGVGMEQKGFHRKFTAILSADVAGYSRLMQDDGAATAKTLESDNQIISDLVKQHRGGVVDSPDGNLLEEFASVVDSVHCVVATQKELQMICTNGSSAIAFSFDCWGGTAKKEVYQWPSS
jgi:class 3 adenylate cyclase